MEENNEGQDFSEEEKKFINELGEQISKEEKGIHMVDEGKKLNIMEAYKKISEIVLGDGVKVSYKLHEPSISMGSISVEGVYFEITDAKAFAGVIKESDGFDVCPMTDGTAKLTITYHDLTNKVK